MFFYGRKEDPFSDQFESIEQAKDFLLDMVAHNAVNDYASNGEVFRNSFDMVKYDHETEEVLEEFSIEAEYEHYHGDTMEHSYYGI